MMARTGRTTVLGAILVLAVAAALAGGRALPFVELMESWLADFRIATRS